jgi:hypothetical protein
MVKDVAQSMIDQGMQAAGWYMVNLDDCWADTTRDPSTGALRADKNRFPSGTLKELADWLHARNFSMGMYTGAGNRTCSSGGRPVPAPYSRGVPGSFGHYEQDAKTFADWVSGLSAHIFAQMHTISHTYDLLCALGTQPPGNRFCEARLVHNHDTFYEEGAHNKVSAGSRQKQLRQGHVAEFSLRRSLCRLVRGGWQQLADWVSGLRFSPKGSVLTHVRLEHRHLCDHCSPDHHDNWGSTEEVIQILATVNEDNHTGPYRWADPDFVMTGGGE